MHQKNARARANLRQICLLNLAWEMLLPGFTRALRHTVDFNVCVFLWLSPTEPRIQHVWSNTVVPDRIANDFLAHFAHIEAESPHAGGLASFYERGPSVRLTPEWAGFSRTEMCNYIWKETGIHYGLSTVIPAADGRCLGHLMLHRERTARNFSKADIGFMEGLIPYISHALSVDPSSEIEFADSIDSGMLLMDRDGKIQYRSASALALASMIENTGCVDLIGRFGVPGFIELVFRRLIDVGRPATTLPPRLQLTNRWGQFDIHAYWLDPMTPGDGLIAIRMECKEPKVLRLASAMQDAQFSAAQQRASLLLLQGKTNREIADALRITINSARDHVKAVLEKANCGTRHDLSSFLLSLPQRNTQSA